MSNWWQKQIPTLHLIMYFTHYEIFYLLYSIILITYHSNVSDSLKYLDYVGIQTFCWRFIFNATRDDEVQIISETNMNKNWMLVFCLSESLTCTNIWKKLWVVTSTYAYLSEFKLDLFTVMIYPMRFIALFVNIEKFSRLLSFIGFQFAFMT